MASYLEQWNIFLDGDNVDKVENTAKKQQLLESFKRTNIKPYIMHFLFKLILK